MIDKEEDEESDFSLTENMNKKNDAIAMYAAKLIAFYQNKKG